jgi:hypothetical protein
MNNLSADQLRQAATIKDEIESLEGELSKILGGSQPPKRGRKPRTGKITFTREKVGKGDLPKRKGMSAAGRAKIAAAARARWAKVKASGKNRL